MEHLDETLHHMQLGLLKLLIAKYIYPEQK